MDSQAPLTPRPLGQLPSTRRVMTTEELRAHGVPPAETATRCRPGGGWRTLLPGVHLLHHGEPTGEDRLRAALLYAAGPLSHQTRQPRAMITGLAALAVHRLPAGPTLRGLDAIDVLVHGTPPVASAPGARVVGAAQPPEPVHLAGVPLAPVPRALADALARLADPASVRRLLVAAVRAGHCEPAEVLQELAAARLLGRPPVAESVAALVAEGRTLAEERLYALVAAQALPDPYWNVDLCLPTGPLLGAVDAYWPDQAVAVELDLASLPAGAAPVVRVEPLGKRELLERLGITLLRFSAERLRSPRECAARVRAAFAASLGREPAVRPRVLPR